MAENDRQDTANTEEKSATRGNWKYINQQNQMCHLEWAKIIFQYHFCYRVAIIESIHI